MDDTMRVTIAKFGWAVLIGAAFVVGAAASGICRVFRRMT